MSFARGERVNIDLGLDDNEEELTYRAPPPNALSSDFVGDILERSSAANPPSAPTLKSSATGFPTHKKRTNRVSAFKQRRSGTDGAALTPRNDSLHAQPPPKVKDVTLDEDEKRRIDQENRQRLDQMSPEEIEEEQRELFKNLSPGLIERLLARSNIDDGSNERNLDPEPPAALPPSTDEQDTPLKSPKGKKVSFAASIETKPPVTPQSSQDSPDKAPPVQAPISASSNDAQLLADSIPSEGNIHFPKPPQPPDLDPSSSTFLNDLHEKYFPDLPYDPSSVSWMQPVDNSDTTSPYHPSQTAMEPAELRFDFRGALLAPSAARALPVTMGLHHHGEAPEAAGYTISELARLSRSAVASQRCVAYQTLGRILYRLGRGEFGVEEPKQRVDGPVQIARDPNQMGDDEEGEYEEESVGSAMAGGLWDLIEEGRIVETLTEEAGRERGHLTAKTYAQEALWNWRRGGGRKRRAV